MPVLKQRKEYNFIGKCKRIDSKYLVVNQSGAFVVLSPEEHNSLMTHRMGDELFSELEAKNIIVTDNNFERVVEDYKLKKANLFQGTSLHIVVPTLRCNQKCVYCHAASVPQDAKGYDMDKETASKVVDFISQSPSKAITIEFQGGEPLLNFAIVQHIVEYAKNLNKTHKKDVRFTIVTNLTLMNQNILNYLIKQEIGICTSFDGPKYVHDKNRKFLDGRGTYDEVVKWIKAIQKSKYKGMNALMTVTRYSLPYYKEIVDEYANLGLKRIWFRYLNNLGFAQEAWKEVGYSAEEFIEFWKKGVDYIYSKDFQKNMMREISSLILTIKVLRKHDPNFLDLQSPCGAAIGQLAYRYDGNIYSCDEGRMVKDDFFKLGNVHEDTYKSLFSSSKTCSLIASSVNDTYLCDACIYQPYCGVCPVLSYINTQNIVPKLAQDFRCKILKAQFEHVFKKIISEKGFREYMEKFEVFKEPVKKKKHGKNKK